MLQVGGGGGGGDGDMGSGRDTENVDGLPVLITNCTINSSRIELLLDVVQKFSSYLTLRLRYRDQPVNAVQETIFVSSENHMKQIRSVGRMQNYFYGKADGAYSNHRAAKG
jgi:hypothetical protein